MRKNHDTLFLTVIFSKSQEKVKHSMFHMTLCHQKKSSNKNNLAVAVLSVSLLYGPLILASLCKSHYYQLHKDNQALILHQ